MQLFPENWSSSRLSSVLKSLNSITEQLTLHHSCNLWAAIWTWTNCRFLCNLTNCQYSWGSWNNLIMKSIRSKIYSMYFRVGFPSAPGLQICFLNIAQVLFVFIQQFLEFSCAWQKALLGFVTAQIILSFTKAPSLILSSTSTFFPLFYYSKFDKQLKVSRIGGLVLCMY